jgi:WD40 repeat protein
VVFSPDGHTLAGGEVNATIQRWDVADPAHPQPLGQPMVAGTTTIFSLAFSRDGEMLASGDFGGTVWVWNLNIGVAIERICAIAGDLTHQQWHRYIPELPYQSLCVS